MTEFDAADCSAGPSPNLGGGKIKKQATEQEQQRADFASTKELTISNQIEDAVNEDSD